MKGNDGKFYPMNPDHNYISRFSERFRGYLSCCSLDHVFRACPHKTSPEIKHKLFEDLWAHVSSSTRKIITNSRTSKVTFTTPTTTPTSHINVLSTHAHPHTSNINFSSPNINPGQPPSKICRFHATFFVNNFSLSSQKPIPIPINNSLPSIYLHLDLIEVEENKMRILLNTGAAMNFGNLSYDLWAILEYPEIVGELIQCGDSTGYDVMQLMATLDLDSNRQPLDHCKMTAVICYRT